MYNESEIHCVGCGALIARAHHTCPKCGQLNLYRAFVPGEHSRERLRERPNVPEGHTRLAGAAAPPAAAPIGVDRTAATVAGPQKGSTVSFSAGDPAESPPAGEDEGRATVSMKAVYAADLVRLEPPGQPETFRLAKGKLIIGYAPRKCDLILREDTVSAQHAEFLCEEDESGRPLVSIRDLGSRNGTYVNGAAIASDPRRLRDGDVIRFADVSYRFRVRGSGGPRETGT